MYIKCICDYISTYILYFIYVYKMYLYVFIHFETYTFIIFIIYKKFHIGPFIYIPLN